MSDAQRAREFDQLVEYLTRSRSFDFGGYKRVGLTRRILKRMRTVGISGFGEYRRYLGEHPDEFQQLFDTILINVTAFFRDDLPWDYIRGEIVPRILAQKGPHDPVRVWSAGCATGEEAYTLAIVLAEALGHDQFRERVKVYATDVDDAALAQARQASYSERDVEGVSPELLDRYFERLDGRYVFRKDLRRCVIFGRNDLMRDAPISRIDLLACRNTLMYFDAATQARVLQRFHFALVDGGYLFLGRAETMLSHAGMFTPVDLRRRVFAKVPRLFTPERTPPPLRPPGVEPVAPTRQDGELRDAAFDASRVAQLVVDAEGRLALVNAAARTLLQLGQPDLGRALGDLEVSYRPVELRSVIEQAIAQRRPFTRGEVPWRVDGGEPRWFDVVVAPLLLGDGTTAGASVSFVEVTPHKLLQQQVAQSQAELEAAYQELQSTNEELETTNEELHSTVEELETTNEELQSTNEELETMNEELQSTNEELQTINDELRLRTEELNQVNAFLESVFTSLRAGVIVLDRELRILVWNARAEDLWGLRADEVDRAHFANLDIGLPVERLVQPLRACLVGEAPMQELVLPATNRRGRPISCRVTAVPLVGRGDGEPNGVIVMLDELPAAP